MKKLFKYLAYVLAIILLLIVATIAYLKFFLPDIGDPQDLKVNITAQKVERGQYLAYHVMMCADCHSMRDFTYFSGPPKPGTEFTGGDIFDQSMGFPGRFVSSNITPFGIGDWTDGELFRLITTGVKRDGSPIFPVMPYHRFGRLDRTDIESVIAFLRTLDPVETNHPVSKADFPMNLIMRTMPQEAQLTRIPPKTDVLAYGSYMTMAAACMDCHTNFSKGKFVGPEGGGGREFHMPDGSIVRTANLTPHETGLGNMSLERFIRLFKRYSDSGELLPKVATGDMQSIMPWYMYGGMTKDDLSAIYAYLQSLEPFENEVEKFVPAK
ncbi:MAG: c-type cytochrome [Bacteroidales bacterium]|nr:c-type cytochrome [Bacteroidales bacterium]HOI33200.1 c-type cytochrome [Bacteroidales bacterium]